MPGLPPDLEAIFGKIHQKKHFSEDQPPRKHWKNIKSYQRAALVPHNLQRFASIYLFQPICLSVPFETDTTVQWWQGQIQLQK